LNVTPHFYLKIDVNSSITNCNLRVKKKTLFDLLLNIRTNLSRLLTSYLAVWGVCLIFSFLHLQKTARALHKMNKRNANLHAAAICRRQSAGVRDARQTGARPEIINCEYNNNKNYQKPFEV